MCMAEQILSASHPMAIHYYIWVICFSVSLTLIIEQYSIEIRRKKNVKCHFNESTPQASFQPNISM